MVQFALLSGRSGSLDSSCLFLVLLLRLPFFLSFLSVNSHKEYQFGNMEKSIKDERASDRSELPPSIPANAKKSDSADLEVPQVVKIESELGTEPDSSMDDGTQYVTGFKLGTIVASMAMACFLVLLDTMVIGTVSHPRTSQLQETRRSSSYRGCSTDYINLHELRQSHLLRTSFIPSTMSVGTPALISSGGKWSCFGSSGMPLISWIHKELTFVSAAPQPLTGKVYTHFKLKVRIWYKHESNV